ncbi:MAG: PatB family C-S lyase [Bacteroidales bacterium]|nr:PatB family C-S lyase [Bacteroidales bacterium]
MLYNFDQLIHRSDTSCVKYDLRKIFFGSNEVIPMWVADMDFATPDFIRDAVLERANHPIYGYTFRPQEYYDTIVQWFKRRHHWEIQKEWIQFTPGIVPALNLAVLAFTNPDDQIIVQPPVYFPFFSAVRHHNRQLVYNQLLHTGNCYEIDFDLFAKQAEKASMLILCNPHNPVGRAWRREELEKLADICLKNNVLVLSDEIHGDLVLPGYQHQVFADIAPEIAEITLTGHAPSKTFNLAGLGTSSMIISNNQLRQKFKQTVEGLHIEMGNLFGIAASTAAFKHGDEWLNQLLNYVQLNIEFTIGFLAEKLPLIRVFKPEATYMIWLDFSAYNLTDEDLKRKMVFEAGLGLNPGIDFGPGGEGFMRINVACPKSLLETALQKLQQAFG